MQKMKLRILVIRLSSIGDIILTTPILRALNSQLHAEIIFLTKRRYAWVLKSNPAIDQIIHYEGGIPSSCRFDYVIDLQKNLRSYLYSKKIRAKRLTFQKLNVRKWLYTAFKSNVLPKEHLVDRYFKGLESLNLKNDGKGLDFFYEKKNIQGLGLPEHYIVVNCGGLYFTKRIPALLAEKIIHKSDFPIVLLGGNDVDKNVKALKGASVFNLIGLTDFETSVAIVEKCTKLITSDSALMHVGAALEKDMEVYWGNTTPSMGMYPYLPIESKAKIKNREVSSLQCRPCSKLGSAKCPKGHFRCMLEQAV